MHLIYATRSSFHNCTIFTREDLSIVVLPTFFSKASIMNGVVWVRKITNDEEGFSKITYEEIEIEIDTINLIHHKLVHFLNWVIHYSQTSEHVSVDTHHNLPNSLLNYYVNDVLVGTEKIGHHAIAHHLMALRTYYDYLSMTGFTDAKNIRLTPKNIKEARQNTSSRTAVKYLTPELRSLLYRSTDSLRDELLLRTGGELGLRSKENQGLLLEDFMIGNKLYKGFKSLFVQMDQEPDRIEFTYHLQGKFTKASRNAGGGRSRTLYIHRTLLEKFKQYYDLERPISTADTLLLSNSHSHAGNPISKSAASRVFTTIKARVMALQANGEVDLSGQKLESDHTHHVLRHSFGTDKFYEFCQKNRIAIDDVTQGGIILFGELC